MFDGILTWIVPMPMYNISNSMASYDMPDDTFNRVFGFTGSVIAWKSVGGLKHSWGFHLARFVWCPVNMVSRSWHLLMDATFGDGDGIWRGWYYAKLFDSCHQYHRERLVPDMSSWHKLFRRTINKQVLPWQKFCADANSLAKVVLESAWGLSNVLSIHVWSAVRFWK